MKPFRGIAGVLHTALCGGLCLQRGAPLQTFLVCEVFFGGAKECTFAYISYVRGVLSHSRERTKERLGAVNMFPQRDGPQTPRSPATGQFFG